MNLQQQFEKECQYSIHTEFKGRSDMFSEKQGKWISIPKGQAWKAYAEWLEKKTEPIDIDGLMD